MQTSDARGLKNGHSYQEKSLHLVFEVYSMACCDTLPKGSHFNILLHWDEWGSRNSKGEASRFCLLSLFDSRGNTFRYCACYTFQLKFTDGTKCDNPLTLTWGPIESRECWDVEGRNRWRWIGEKVIWNGSCLTWKVEEGTHVLRRKIAFWSWERQGNRFSRPSRIRHGQHLHLPCWSCEIIHVFLSSL